MAIEVETKDCTALSDTELEEMADLCASGPVPYEAGMLSKQVEAWVLATTAREGGSLRGFSFCTLERIGGTPSVLVGLGSIGRSPKRDQVLAGIRADQLRRAVLAFPDEDVLIGTQLAHASGFSLFDILESVVPRPGHKASGEERAWGRRLAKRFGIAQAHYDDRAFRVRGDGSLATVFDHEVTESSVIADDLHGFFADLDPHQGDSLIAFAWAMAEELEHYA